MEKKTSDQKGRVTKILHKVKKKKKKKPKKNVMKKIWQQKKKKEKHDNNDNWKKRDYCKWDQL